MNPHPSSPADRIKRAFSLAAVTNRAMVAALALVMLGAASCSNGTDQESSGTTSEQVATSTVETSTTLGDAQTTTAQDAATTTAAETSTTVADGASTSSKPSRSARTSKSATTVATTSATPARWLWPAMAPRWSWSRSSRPMAGRSTWTTTMTTRWRWRWSCAPTTGPRWSSRPRSRTATVSRSRCAPVGNRSKHAVRPSIEARRATGCGLAKAA